MKILHVGDMHLGSQPPDVETRMSSRWVTIVTPAVAPRAPARPPRIPRALFSPATSIRSTSSPPIRSPASKAGYGPTRRWVGTRPTVPAVWSGDSATWAPTAEYSWFGLNFRSTTPWKVTVERDGKPVLIREGPPDDNMVVTEPLDLAHFEICRIHLEQQPPACGHASPYVVFGAQPVRTFNPYPPIAR